jgi:hypothetical protein
VYPTLLGPLTPHTHPLLFGDQVLTVLVRCHPVFVNSPEALEALLLCIRSTQAQCSSGAKRARLALLLHITQVGTPCAPPLPCSPNPCLPTPSPSSAHSMLMLMYVYDGIGRGTRGAAMCT